MIPDLETRRQRVGSTVRDRLQSTAALTDATASVPVDESYPFAQLCFAVYEGFGAHDGSLEDVVPAGAAVELSRYQSLVHGRAGNSGDHRQTTADLLLGDYLKAMAFEELTALSVPPEVVERCVAALSAANLRHYAARTGRANAARARSPAAAAGGAAAVLGATLGSVDDSDKLGVRDAGERLGESITAPPAGTAVDGDSDPTAAIETLLERCQSARRDRVRRSLRALTDR